MIQKSAKVTQSSETRAHVVERGCRNGLNIGHLRAFVQQADIAGLDDNTHVWLTDKLQASSPYHDVEIAASVKESRTDDIAQDESGDPS